MKKNIVYLTSLFVIAFILALVVSVPVPAQDKKGDDEIKSLISRIETLEKKVKEQDAKITALNNELDKVQKPMLALPANPDFDSLPKGSKPFQFNGQSFYMVPIKSSVDVK